MQNKLTKAQLKEAVETKIREINELIEQNTYPGIQFRFMTWVGTGIEHHLDETTKLLDDTLQFKEQLKTDYFKDSGISE